LTRNTTPFWKTTPLEAMSPEQWESLCDGCGQCCLVKLEDEDTGTIHTTDVHCRLFDGKTCRCKDYPNRKKAVPDCVTLTPKDVAELPWLPNTCAYRLIHEGKDLYPWHPLVSGDTETVHTSGASVRGKTWGSETKIRNVQQLVRRIVR
jgi:uncharacterized protein